MAPPINIVIKPSAPKSKKKPRTPAEQVAHDTAVAKAKAGSPAYLAAQAQLAAAREQAKLDNHATDPWVIPVIGKGGVVLGYRYVAGYTPPKNAIKYGGEPLTKSMLASVWRDYTGSFQQFTGRIASEAEIVNILRKGQTVYGMQAALAKLPGFKNSPIYKAQAATINSAAKALWGTNATPKMIQDALAQGWNTDTLEQHLRNDPRYLKGPEYQTNKATMKDTYQQIYGAPDKNAMQAIAEVAANGWTTAQFADYLRSQPQYKTSIEYQSHAVNFLDAMGLFTGAVTTLTPGTNATGGTAVTNAPVVPGKAAPLNPVLPFTPTLPGAPGLTGGSSTSTPPPTSTPPGTSTTPGVSAGTALGQDRLAAGRGQRLGV